MRTDSFAPLEITVRDVGGFPADAVGAIDCTTWIMHGVRPRASFDAVRLISYFALFY